MKLQQDIDRLGCWARKWGVRFQSVKFNIMQITRKRTNKIEASNTLEGTVLENVDSIKYLGATITHDLDGIHISATYRGACSPHFGIWQLCLGSPRPGSSTRNRKSSE